MFIVVLKRVKFRILSKRVKFEFLITIPDPLTIIKVNITSSSPYYKK